MRLIEVPKTAYNVRTVHDCYTNGGTFMFGLEDYIQLLVKGDQKACYLLVNEHLSSFENRMEEIQRIKEIYFEVFQPSMQQIGHLWAANKISVAQEHVATAITQHMMAGLYGRLFDGHIDAMDKKVLITCPSNELHELPSRMLADLLVLEGAEVIFLGANTPADDIVEMIEIEQPDALIVSCTIQRHMSEVKQLIEKLPKRRPKVLVGGYAFDVDPRQAGLLGADQYCATFEESIQAIFNQEAVWHQTV